MRRLAWSAVLIAAPVLAQAGSAPPPVKASLIAPALRVADCARSQHFYEKALGATVLMSRDLGHIHETMLALGGEPDRPFAMLICPAASLPRPAAAAGHARLIVRVTDMDALVVRLDNAGIAHPAVASSRPGIRVMQLADPDGHEMELVQTASRPEERRP